MQGPCPFCGGFFLDYPRHLEEEYAKKAHEAERERQLRAASALAIPADPPTGQVPPGYVVVDPRTVSKREEATVVSVSVSDQITAMTQRLQRMPRRHALVRLPDDSIHEMVTNEIADPRVDTTAIEREQLERWFVPMGEQNLALPIEPLPVTRSKILR